VPYLATYHQPIIIVTTFGNFCISYAHVTSLNRTRIVSTIHVLQQKSIYL